MKKCLMILAFLLLSNSFLMSQVKESLWHDDYNRKWFTYLPKNYSEEKTYPLLIALHGGGGTAKQLMKNTRKRFNTLADEENFIVVYPQGVKKSWNDNNQRNTYSFSRKTNIDDLGFIKKMIANLESNYSINSSAIFACGISNGGLMSQTLAMELPEKIKAIGMVASNFGEDEIKKIATAQPFSVLFIHGDADPIFPYKEGQIYVLKKYRGKVLGIEKSIDYMCMLNGNTPEPIQSDIENTKNDDCSSEHLKYPNAENPSLKVELIKVKNGGHTWPGGKEQHLISKIVGKTTQDFNACDTLWSFFKSSID